MLTPSWMFGQAWQLYEATPTEYSAMYLRLSKDETILSTGRQPVSALH